jgi:hypothetical protein
MQFNPISLDKILTMETALLVLAGLAISLVGATVATAARHWTSQNWHPKIEDVWYYVLSGSIGSALVILGADTITILSVTTGVNTPLAVLKTTIDKFYERRLEPKILSNEERIAQLETEKERKRILGLSK